MIIGYARVSSRDQNLARQIKDLKENGCEMIFEEKQSAKDFARPVYEEMKRKLRFGDVLIVHDLSRLGRNKEGIKNEWEYFISNNIDIYVLNLPILDTRKYKDLEGVGKLVSDLVLSLFSWLVEEERLRIRTAQRGGIEIAKKEGKFKGRPIRYRADAKNPRDRMTYDQIVSRLRKGESVMDIKRYTGVSRTTIYKIKDEIEDKEEFKKHL